MSREHSRHHISLYALRRLVRFSAGFMLCYVISQSAHAQTLYRCQELGRVVYQDGPCETGTTDQRVATGDPDSGAGPAPGLSRNEDGWLWLAHRDGRHVFITGSIHFGEENMYPLPTAVMEAFRRSGTLMVEANILSDTSTGLTQDLLDRGIYTDGRTLNSTLDDKTWQRLQKVLEKMDIPATVVMGQKPWLAAMTLTSVAISMAGLSAEYGVDRHFLLGAQGSKTVIELEGVKKQIKFLDKMPIATQEVLLNQTLDDIESEHKLRRLVEAWKSGDAQLIEDLVQRQRSQDAKAERLYELLLSKRHGKMADRINRKSTDPGNYFVVVGAAHLVGEDSLLSALAELGFTVQRVGMR